MIDFPSSKSIMMACFLIASSAATAEMAQIDDNDLAEVTGQNGVYLTGDIRINENGGPLEDAYFGDCSDADKVCGARLAFSTQQDGGWFVVDNIRGNIAFEGLTLKVRNISSGFDGDGLAFGGAAGKDVVEIGLPESLRFENFQYTIATANRSRPTDPSSGLPGDTQFNQVDLMTVEIGGEVNLEGNLLVFPTD